VSDALAAEIRAAVRAVPPALGPLSDLERLAALGPHVPAAVHSFGFEMRLAAGPHAVDLGAALSPRRIAADALADVPHDGGAWQAIAAFGRRWRDRTSASWRSIPFVFLEFDAESAHQFVPVPSLFAALDSPLSCSGAASELDAAREAASLLHGGALSRTLEAQLEASFARLPDGARVLHLALMLGRPERSLRLSVLLPRESAPAYLAALGGHDAAENAKVLLDHGLGCGPGVQLDFDLGPPIAARVGLGIFPETPGGWPPLLGDVLSLGVCDPAKVVSLLHWPGENAAGECGSVRLRRRLSHLKLSGSPRRGFEVKAYLGVQRLAITPLAEADRGPAPAAARGSARAPEAE
jgi:hypothetical protein